MLSDTRFGDEKMSAADYGASGCSSESSTTMHSSPCQASVDSVIFSGCLGATIPIKRKGLPPVASIDTRQMKFYCERPCEVVSHSHSLKRLTSPTRYQISCIFLHAIQQYRRVIAALLVETILVVVEEGGD